MSATMITIANFTEDGAEALQRYVEGVLPLLAQAGAEVQRYQGLEPLVGNDRFDLVAVMKFPSEAAMKQAQRSPRVGQVFSMHLWLVLALKQR